MEPTTAAVAVATTEVVGNPVIRAFNEGGFVMYIILIIGLMTLFLVIERFLVLKSLRIDKK